MGAIDFIVMASDGVFGKLSNQKVLKILWEESRRNFTARDYPLHQLAGASVNSLLKAAIYARSSDNLSAAILCFSGYKKQLRYDLADYVQKHLGENFKPEERVMTNTYERHYLAK